MFSSPESRRIAVLDSIETMLPLLGSSRVGSKLTFSYKNLPYSIDFQNYYWVVHGLVPIEIADALYLDPVGKKDIRAGGDCTCPPPREWMEWYTDEGVRVYDMGTHARFEKYKNENSPIWDILERTYAKSLFSDTPAATYNAKAYVETYHIDSDYGLLLFIRALLGK